MRRYLLNIAVSVDRLLNTIAGGSYDLCISSRLALNYPNSLIRKFVDYIFLKLGQKNHCAKSLYDEKHEEFNENWIIKGN